MTIDELIAEATERGRAQGRARRAGIMHVSGDMPEWSPLSGEWAGESISELLGDLLDVASAISDDDYGWAAITDAYETAALDAYYGEGE